MRGENFIISGTSPKLRPQNYPDTESLPCLGLSHRSSGPRREHSRRVLHLLEPGRRSKIVKIQDLTPGTDSILPIFSPLPFFCLLPTVSCILVFIDLFCTFEYDVSTVFGPETALRFRRRETRRPCINTIQSPISLFAGRGALSFEWI